MDATEHRTHCPFCALQCGMLIRADPTRVEPVEVRGDPDFPVNRGQLCIKGAQAGQLLLRMDRLMTPMVRDTEGTLRPASWDTAMAIVAEKVLHLREHHGADSIGVFGSGGLTNEKAYALGKFTRVVLRSANVDYNGRFCMSSAAAAQNRALGLDRGLPFPISDLAEADCIVSWGSNWYETMPPIRQWFDRQKERGGRLIVVDPRKSPTAQLADLHVQPVPGSDLALANGLLYLAIQRGDVDLEYIERRTSGFDAVRRVVAWYSPDRVERITGVSEAVMHQMIQSMTEVSRTLLLSGRGAEQQSKGTDTVHAFINLMLALGKMGKAGSGYACLTGQGNGQGGREHGQKADQLPGYRSIENDAHRAVVAAAWGIEPNELPHRGKSAMELLESLGAVDDPDHPIHALLVFGSNVAVAAADAARIRERLRALELLVVVDTFLNETAQLAHVVLPSLLWTEESGTMTNLEGRVLLRRSITRPPAGPRSDLAILSDLSRRLGQAQAFTSDEPSAVFDELARLTEGAPADYSGLSHQRLSRTHGIQWPSPDPSHPGTERVFSERFGHDDGKAKFFPVEHRSPAELPDEDYPLYFTTGRWREHYNSGAQTRGIAELSTRRPEPVLEVHPSTLARFGMTGDGLARVETRRGSLLVRLQPTRTARMDTIFLPFHYGGDQSANLLTVPARDPISRMPEFKICAARLRRVEAK